jgi:deoxycytidine triphosphate deaminase
VYLSDRDIQWAIDKGTLILRPPSKVDPTSIDLHLDSVEEAKVWDTEKLRRTLANPGIEELELHLGVFKYADFSEEHLKTPPAYHRGDTNALVCRREDQILVRPHGFLLWQTKEEVGTPLDDPQYICFVDGKSTKARTGILVHLTAPTIHAGWIGKVVLEIVNLGPFTFVLQENDVIAQLTVATISSIPGQTHREAGTSTLEQVHVTGAAKGQPKRKTTAKRGPKN